MKTLNLEKSRNSIYSPQGIFTPKMSQKLQQDQLVSKMTLQYKYIQGLKINSKLHVHVVHVRIIIAVAVAIIINIHVLLCSVTIAVNQSMVFMNNLCRKGENYEVQ